MTKWIVEDLVKGLEGSPYSLPQNAEGRDRALPLLDRLHRLEERSVRAHHQVVSRARTLLRQSNRVREIYETNKIEGLGPSLAVTNKLLLSPEAERLSQSINRFTLAQTLRADPKTQDVLGMHGAKLLAEDIVRSQAQGRPLSEVDLRDMHALVLGDHGGAGRYKRFVNEIQGAEHTPYFPSDVGAAMQSLIKWQERTRRERLLPPVVTAATSHAWLTHIHPFEDGNGRIARLLANIIIGSAAFPPLIVRSTADRGRYITALAVSDEGGDLAELINVFVRVLQRGVIEMEKPKWAVRLFQGEIDARSAPEFQQWSSAFALWLTDFGAALRLNGLVLDSLAVPTYADFERFRQVGISEALWTSVISDPREPERGEVFLVLKRPGRLSRFSEKHYPGLYFFYDTGVLWSSMRYSRLTAQITEALICPEGSGHATYVWERSEKARRGASDAPGYVADLIASAIRSGSARPYS